MYTNQDNFKIHAQFEIDNLKSQFKSKKIMLCLNSSNSLIFFGLSLMNAFLGNWIASALNILCTICWIFAASINYNPWKNLKNKIAQMEEDNINYIKNEKEKKENLNQLNFFAKN